MSRAVGAAVLAAVVLSIGCSLPAQNVATPSATSRETATRTVAPTPTVGTADPAPPGVTERGIENASALLAAHVATLNRTGHVSVGEANTTVLRSGLLVNATSIGRASVAPGSDCYYEVVRTRAGPLNRTVQMYGNGSVEFRRTGPSSIVVRPLRSTEVLASADLLDPYLRGGAYNVTRIDERGDPALVALRANGTDNESAVLEALPPNAESVSSFEARVVVDEDGRIRSLSADVGYVISGQNRTHDFSFELVQLELESVERPAWVPTDDETPTAGDGDSDGEATETPTDPGGTDRPGAGEPTSDDDWCPGTAGSGDPLTGTPTATQGDERTAGGDVPSLRFDRYWSRSVVSTSGWRA